MEGRLRTERFGVSVGAGESGSARDPIGRVGPAELWLLAGQWFMCSIGKIQSTLRTFIIKHGM